MHESIRTDAPDASYRRTRSLLLRAERAGFDSTLLAQHAIHPSNTEDDGSIARDDTYESDWVGTPTGNGAGVEPAVPGSGEPAVPPKRKRRKVG